jgi:hypothetical protein
MMDEGAARLDAVRGEGAKTATCAIAALASPDRRW